MPRYLQAESVVRLTSVGSEELPKVIEDLGLNSNQAERLQKLWMLRIHGRCERCESESGVNCACPTTEKIDDNRRPLTVLEKLPHTTELTKLSCRKCGEQTPYTVSDALWRLKKKSDWDAFFRCSPCLKKGKEEKKAKKAFKKMRVSAKKARGTAEEMGKVSHADMVVAKETARKAQADRAAAKKSSRKAQADMATAERAAEKAEADRAIAKKSSRQAQIDQTAASRSAKRTEEATQRALQAEERVDAVVKELQAKNKTSEPVPTKAARKQRPKKTAKKTKPLKPRDAPPRKRSSRPLTHKPFANLFGEGRFRQIGTTLDQ